MPLYLLLPQSFRPAKYAVNHHHHRSVGFKRADWLLVGGQETRTREPHLIVPQTITKRLGRATKTAHNTELWRLLICDSTAALSQVKTVIVIARTTHPNYATNPHPSNVVICLLSCCWNHVRPAPNHSQPSAPLHLGIPHPTQRIRKNSSFRLGPLQVSKISPPTRTSPSRVQQLKSSSPSCLDLRCISTLR